MDNTLQLNQQGGGRIDIPLPESIKWEDIILVNSSHLSMGDGISLDTLDGTFSRGYSGYTSIYQTIPSMPDSLHGLSAPPMESCGYSVMRSYTNLSRATTESSKGFRIDVAYPMPTDLNGSVFETMYYYNGDSWTALSDSDVSLSVTHYSHCIDRASQYRISATGADVLFNFSDKTYTISNPYNDLAPDSNEIYCAYINNYFRPGPDSEYTLIL